MSKVKSSFMLQCCMSIVKLASIFCDEQALLKFVQTLIYLATFARLTQGRQYISISTYGVIWKEALFLS